MMRNKTQHYAYSLSHLWNFPSVVFFSFQALTYLYAFILPTRVAPFFKVAQIRKRKIAYSVVVAIAWWNVVAIVKFRHVSERIHRGKEESAHQIV